MKKRGQIYILVALVLSIVIFGLVTVTNKVHQEGLKSNFEKLSKNYATESAILVNSLMNSPFEDVGDSFNEFSQLFTGYAKTQSPDFGLIYAFNYDGDLYVGNFLKDQITVDWWGNPGSPESLIGCYSVIPASVGFDGLVLDIEGVEIPPEEFEPCTLETPFVGGSIDLTIEGVLYTFTLKEDQPEVIMVSWESRGNQRKVFTEGDLEQEE